MLLEGKKFYIGVDCEGVACVVGEPGKGLGHGEQYQFALRQAAREANAAAETLFELGAETVVTKRSLSWTSAVSRHPQAVCGEIREAVRRAAYRLDEMKCYSLPSPLSVEIRYKRMEDAAKAGLTDREGKPFVRQDAFTRSGIVNSVEDIF